jgi:hypothetical protein
MNTDTNTLNLTTATPPKVTGYLLLFRNTGWAQDEMSEGEIRGNLEKVNTWFAELSATGKLVAAQPLMDDAVIVSGKGGRSVTDGPFTEAKEVIGGYVLLSVATMDEAVAIAKQNPMLDYGHVTEVRPTTDTCPHTYEALKRLALAAA